MYCLCIWETVVHGSNYVLPMFLGNCTRILLCTAQVTGKLYSVHGSNYVLPRYLVNCIVYTDLIMYCLGIW